MLAQVTLNCAAPLYILFNSCVCVCVYKLQCHQSSDFVFPALESLCQCLCLKQEKKKTQIHIVRCYFYKLTVIKDNSTCHRPSGNRSMVCLREQTLKKGALKWPINSEDSLRNLFYTVCLPLFASHGHIEIMRKLAGEPFFFFCM